MTTDPAIDLPGVTVHHGDCLDVLRTLPDASVHAVVTDPPYELVFMGKKWDGSGIAFNVDVWRECLRVLKPGGHLLAFGGSRTWHRLAVAIEDAGFEMRDSIAWLYGSGFPKSMDVSKAIDKAAGATREVIGTAADFARDGAKRNATNHGDTRSVTNFAGDTAHGWDSPVTAPATPAAQQWSGWGTALKPAHEPVVCARKPLSGTVAANVLEHGTGALNIDGCRVGSDGGCRRGPEDLGIRGPANDVLGAGLDLGNAAPRVEGLGRWPTNVVLDGDAADELDRVGPRTKDGVAVNRNRPAEAGAVHPHTVYGDYANRAGADVTYGGEGGPSRFFPTFRYQAKAPTRERPVVTHDDGTKIAHPTVKPLALMRWLVRLVTPAGGTVLDPFLGSGTTAQAARDEGFVCLGIERESDYMRLIAARLAAAPVEAPPPVGQVSLLDLLDEEATA